VVREVGLDGQASLAGLLERWGEDASALLAGHLELAQWEMAQSVRLAAVALAAIALVVPLVGVGLLLLAVGTALALGQLIPLPWAFLGLGCACLLPAAVAVPWAVARWRAGPGLLGASRAEAVGTLSSLRAAGTAP
jgi:predicted membrane metal-binding protein